jgi:hypothetical protein
MIGGALSSAGAAESIDIKQQQSGWDNFHTDIPEPLALWADMTTEPQSEKQVNEFFCCRSRRSVVVCRKDVRDLPNA